MIIISNHFGYAKKKIGSQKFHGFLKASFSESADRQTHVFCDVHMWSSSQGTMMMVKSGQLWIRKHNLRWAEKAHEIHTLRTPVPRWHHQGRYLCYPALGEAREAREQRSTLDHDLHGSGELFQEHLPQRFLFFWHFVQAIPRAGDGLRNLLDLVPTKHGKANTLGSKLPGREIIEKIKTT